ncbi:MAG: LysR family transcriptional regulator [Acidaminococcus sp.]|jgi:DNA-binding transcriptional LysR family regulator|nr:LysR family transcriptional regulator [Acidaminococcus sp.]MCI2100695.1 LysR family transcriptional regulator [Acidaminococcus sp.]MCI2115016.1 LysR family transcriptional regulator [Acidaminococcus sp.]MCI2117040.1 LysR family transcriptional regulator [Acidaminococcus sp.]
MLFNTEYFRVLCQSESISSAAKKLHVSHQNLSKYIKNLEKEYHTTLFTRSPKLTLTESGKAMLSSMEDITVIEENLKTRIEEIHKSNVGILRIGTPEGRFRIVFPPISAKMQQEYPQVRMVPTAAPSFRLKELLLRNELDIALIDRDFIDPIHFRQHSVLEETLYLVVSSKLIQDFGHMEMWKQFSNDGADLIQLRNMPFILNHENSISRRCIDEWCVAHGIKIYPVMELSQMDLHILLSAQNYAASFCWSMYLPLITEQNQLHKDNLLRVFPIKNFPAHNHIVIASLKDKVIPAFGKTFCKLMRELFFDIKPPVSV